MLLGRRYLDDGIPEWDVNPVQLKYRRQLLEKIRAGVYKTEAVDECLCKSKKLERLSHKERLGLPFGNVICKDCGLIITTPRLKKESLPDFYSNEYHPLVFGFEDVGDFEYMVRKEQGYIIFNFIKKYFGDKKSMKVAEIGAGVGHNLRIFREEAAKLGIEVDAHGGEYSEACVKYGVEKLGLNLVQGGTEALVKTGVRFDCIILSHVLEHFADPHEDLRLVKQMLAPNGLLYIEVPGVMDIHNKVEYKCDYLRYTVLAHMYNFSLGTLSNLVTGNGFEIVTGNEYARSLFRQKNGASPETMNYYNKISAYLENLEHQRQLFFEFHTLNAEIQKMRTSMEKTHKDEIAKLLTEKKRLEQHYEDLKTLVECVEKGHKAEIEKMLAGFKSAGAPVTGLVERILAVEKKYETEMLRLFGELSETGKVIEKLQKEKSEAEVKAEQLQKAKAEAQAKVEQLHREKTEVKAEVEQLQTEMKKLADTYKSETERFRKEQANIQTKIIQLQTEVRKKDEQYSADVEKLATDINSLIEDGKSKDEYIDQLVNSMSWKITAPFRALSKPFAGRKGKQD